MATNPNIRFGNNQLHDVGSGGGVGVGAATNAPNNDDVKAYVDAVAQGLDIKPSARALASVAIGTLSGLATTIDGVAFTVDGMRAQLTAESSAINNGPWLVHSGAWTRPTDFAAGSSAAGAFTFIEQGTVWSDTGWVCTADTGSDIVGTNSLPWVQFSSAGVISVTGGLTKTGNVVSVANADGTLVVTTGDVRRAAITGDVGVPAGSNAATIANSAVTLAKIANLAANRLLGNDTGSAAPVALTVGGGVEFTGAGGVQRSALTGDVTALAGSGATAIASHAVTNAKIRQGAGLSVVGVTGNATADVADIVGSSNSQALMIHSNAIGWSAILDTDLPSTVTGAHFAVTQAASALPNSVNLGALTSGVLQQTVSGSVSTPAAVSVASGRVPFGAASGGGIATDSRLVYSTAGGGELTVNGDVTAGNNVSVGNNLTVAQTVNVGLDLEVAGPATVHGFFEALDSAEISLGLSVLTGDLTVAVGNIILPTGGSGHGNITLAGNLSASGTVSGGGAAFGLTTISARLDLSGGELNLPAGAIPGGGATATLGTVGGSGPVTSAMFRWAPATLNGSPGFFPFFT